MAKLGKSDLTSEFLDLKSFLVKFSAKSERRIFGQNLAPKSQNLTLDHNSDPENGKIGTI